MSAQREYLEFYRVDQGPATRRFLVPAIAFLTVGPPLILFSATMKQMPGHGFFGFVGAALMMTGLVTGFGGIATLLLDDRYLGVTEDGLVIHIGREETRLAWDDIRSIHRDDTAVVVSPKDRPDLKIVLARAQLDAVASHLEDRRRKSAWNLAPR